jgi:hypothetical protein
MIKFEFIVDDIDAAAIMYAVREAALKNDIAIIEYMADQTLSDEERKARIDWCRRNKEHTLGLLAKMTNTRV